MLYAVLEKQESCYIGTLMGQVPVVITVGDSLYDKIDADYRIWGKIEQERIPRQLRGLNRNQQAKFEKLTAQNR